ncbi:hypothetical protein FB45DRAFT_999006 [Roridomyces roridus]|uniref:Uncharacterized protein n=1 Tax=Roridomyces roridus TaxID=1738132 RepID=A0AAD7CA24_9AGAR|nr:hypothetical protein FB45DRAFT_999006 [Roridomyces roridus]
MRRLRLSPVHHPGRPDSISSKHICFMRPRQQHLPLLYLGNVAPLTGVRSPCMGSFIGTLPRRRAAFDQLLCAHNAHANGCPSDDVYSCHSVRLGEEHAEHADSPPSERCQGDRSCDLDAGYIGDHTRTLSRRVSSIRILKEQVLGLYLPSACNQELEHTHARPQSHSEFTAHNAPHTGDQAPTNDYFSPVPVEARRRVLSEASVLFLVSFLAGIQGQRSHLLVSISDGDQVAVHPTADPLCIIKFFVVRLWRPRRMGWAECDP